MLNRLLHRLADLILARPGRVVAACVALVLAGGGYGFDVIDRLSPAGYEVIGSESTLAAEVLADEFDTGPANLVVLAQAVDGTVDDEAAALDGAALTERLAALPAVDDVTSYWSTGAAPLVSGDGTAAIVAARIIGTEHEIYDHVEAIRDEFAGRFGALEVTVGGSAAANLEIVEESERDLIRAELIAIPITTIIMLLVFRSVIAALLPLVVSAVAVVGTAAALKGLTEITLVTVFALNLTTALGLGMGVDFSLFTISRWREERTAGADPDDALRTTITTAGRSILFSGLTTAGTLAALLLFDYPLLRSLAYAGFAVVLLATFGGLVALPATIALLGDRVDRWQIRRTTPGPVDEGGWYRTARLVMSRPLLVIAITGGALLVLGTPFLGARFGIPDDRSLPTSSQSRQVADNVRAGFDSRQFGALALVGPSVADGDPIATYAAEVSRVDGVALVETGVGVFIDGAEVGPSPAPSRFVSEQGVWLSIVPEVEPVSAEAEVMVADIRAVPTPSGADGVGSAGSSEFLLGGESARLVDNKAELGSKLPLMGVWVFVVISVLLFASFRSLLLPLKAIVLNLLSLTAAFGALVWIFQDGRLSGLLGFTPTGLTDAQTPVIIFCIAFGLSMDYEVFLLSRIKEEWDRTGDAERAVAVGLQKTGSIITAAAVLMAVVFLSFATGRVTSIQMIGIGLALSIVADATLVRSLLVPAFMKVAGRWNWYPATRSVAAGSAGGGTWGTAGGGTRASGESSAGGGTWGTAGGGTRGSEPVVDLTGVDLDVEDGATNEREGVIR